MQVVERVVDGLLVHRHHLRALVLVLLRDGVLEQLQRLVDGQHAREAVERRLHDAVDALAQSRVGGELRRVDRVELQVLLGDLGAHVRRDVVLQVLD